MFEYWRCEPQAVTIFAAQLTYLSHSVFVRARIAGIISHEHEPSMYLY